MEEDTGRCINCGFYGKQLRDETESIHYEATPTDRQTGRSSPFQGVKGVRPRCFRNKADYGWDLYKPLDEKELLTQISEDRKCSFWYPYTEYLSPKAHYEEFKMLELERKRQKFEQTTEERRKKFEQRMESDRKAFEVKLDERNRQERKHTNRIMIGLAIAAIIFAAMQVYAALASINPEHWLFKWFR